MISKRRHYNFWKLLNIKNVFSILPTELSGAPRNKNFPQFSKHVIMLTFFSRLPLLELIRNEMQQEQKVIFVIRLIRLHHCSWENHIFHFCCSAASRYQIESRQNICINPEKTLKLWQRSRSNFSVNNMSNASANATKLFLVPIFLKRNGFITIIGFTRNEDDVPKSRMFAVICREKLAWINSKTKQFST